MKKILIISLAALTFVSCGNKNKKKTAAVQEAVKTEATEYKDIHNSRNSVDFAGTYEGVLPCADCDGIRTVITLDYEGNYTIFTTYLGKGAPKSHSSSGAYEWNDDGSRITLMNESKPNKYFVGENRITKLDMEGEIIKGDLADKYILQKQ